MGAKPNFSDHANSPSEIRHWSASQSCHVQVCDDRLLGTANEDNISNIKSTPPSIGDTQKLTSLDGLAISMFNPTGVLHTIRPELLQTLPLLASIYLKFTLILLQVSLIFTSNQSPLGRKFRTAVGKTQFTEPWLVFLGGGQFLWISCLAIPFISTPLHKRKRNNRCDVMHVEVFRDQFKSNSCNVIWVPRKGFSVM